jgi:hypothetical protein
MTTRRRRVESAVGKALPYRRLMSATALRRAAASALALLLALPPGAAFSAVSTGAGVGVIQGVVKLEGRPLSGVTVAFIELQTGEVVRAVSGDDGSYEAQAQPGEYAVTTESQAGLTVGQAPLRVTVTSGQVASADVELLKVASALQQTLPQGTPQEPAPETPASATLPAGEPQQPAAPVFAETTGSGAEIRFQPVTCFVAGEFPLLDAEMSPLPSVARARVYFKAALGETFYYVEMNQDQGKFFGKLPRPRVEASPITYYIQSTTTEFEESQTREIEAIVVEQKSECGDRLVAAFGPPGAVTVFSAASGASIIAPAGFAAAGAGLAIGTISVIAAAAAAAGVVGGVTVPPSGGGPTPPPVIIVPTPIPTPVPLPQPTPTPITSGP